MNKRVDSVVTAIVVAVVLFFLFSYNFIKKELFWAFLGSAVNREPYFLFSLFLSYLIIAVFYFFSSKYNPSGFEMDMSHHWVVQGTQNHSKDATTRDVYEHFHGPGSWAVKVYNEKRAILIIGVIFAVLGPFIMGAAGQHNSSMTPVSTTRKLISVMIGVVTVVSFIVSIRQLKENDKQNLNRHSNSGGLIQFDADTIAELILYMMIYIIKPVISE